MKSHLMFADVLSITFYNNSITFFLLFVHEEVLSYLFLETNDSKLNENDKV